MSMNLTVKTREDAEATAREHGHELGAWRTHPYAFDHAVCIHENCVAYAFDAPEGINLRNLNTSCPVRAWTREEVRRIAQEFGHDMQEFHSHASEGTGDVAYCENPGCHLCVIAAPFGGPLTLAYGVGHECPAPS